MARFEPNQITDLLIDIPDLSSGQIHDQLSTQASYATIKRALQKLLEDGSVIATGKGKATKYKVSPAFLLLQPVNVERYFSQEIDQRSINKSFNFELIGTVLSETPIFSDSELKSLNTLQKKYTTKIAELTKNQFDQELERLSIDLSWKSSQIEGNTYSLLETERLLKEKEEAVGKSKDEANMLLNHKEAIDFIVNNKDYLNDLSISKIENIHSILIKNLAVDRNIRKRRVGITGTNYKPIDNEFQIREALESMCLAINNRKNVFEKSLLTLLLLSYIQPFNDGNKRTARIISNGILINKNYCPISFRTVESIDYKKAMLIFYEKNNLATFKDIFIEQFRFAVESYF
jgi:Fic family protein